MRNGKRAVFASLSIPVMFCSSGTGDPAAQKAELEHVLVPVIDGDWWQVAGDPDLGPYTAREQQPVDFGVWQAADGTWQLWSCIRHTKCGGNTRLFHRWEGKRLTDKDWAPMGIAMEATAKPSHGCSTSGASRTFSPAHGLIPEASARGTRWCFTLKTGSSATTRAIWP